MTWHLSFCCSGWLDDFYRLMQKAEQQRDFQMFLGSFARKPREVRKWSVARAAPQVFKPP